MPVEVLRSSEKSVWLKPSCLGREDRRLRQAPSHLYATSRVEALAWLVEKKREAIGELQQQITDLQRRITETNGTINQLRSKLAAAQRAEAAADA